MSLALNWIQHHTPADCVVLGASKPEQLDENLRAIEEGASPGETVSVCDRVWATARPEPEGQSVAVHTAFGPPMIFWQDGANFVRLQNPDGASPVKQATDARFASVVALNSGKGVLLAYERGPAKGATTVVIEKL